MPAKTPEENRARARAWQLKNPERYKARQAKYAKDQSAARVAKVKIWRLAHPERARTARVHHEGTRRARKRNNGGDAVAARKLILEWRALPSFLCYLCEREFPIAALTVDHRTPIARGGQHDPSNLAKSCGTCNRQKSDKLIYDRTSEGDGCGHAEVACD